MGVAAYNRGTAKMRRDIDNWVDRKRQERLAAKNLEDAYRIMERDFDRQADELEQLKTEVAELKEAKKLLEADLQDAMTENDSLRKRVDSAVRMRQAYLNAMEIHKEKHQILSEIIRLALTPEQYHQYREIVRD